MPSIATELEKLAELHSNGQLTDQEFARAKRRLLGNKKKPSKDAAEGPEQSPPSPRPKLQPNLPPKRPSTAENLGLTPNDNLTDNVVQMGVIGVVCLVCAFIGGVLGIEDEDPAAWAALGGLIGVLPGWVISRVVLAMGIYKGP